MATNVFQTVRYGRAHANQREYEMHSGSGAITPGDAIETVVEAGETKVQPASSAAPVGGQTLVAVEARGRGQAATDTYVVGANEYVRALECGPGVGLFVNLAAGSDLATAANANITEGDLLTQEADGTWRGIDATEDATSAQAKAEETLDNSAAGAGATAKLAVVTV